MASENRITSDVNDTEAVRPQGGPQRPRQTTLEEHSYARSSRKTKEPKRVSPRDNRAYLAQGVLQAVKDGAYTTVQDGVTTTWDLAVPTAILRSNTAFYPHDSSLLGNWQQRNMASPSTVELLSTPSGDGPRNPTIFLMKESRTLTVARSYDGVPNVGVLNFASANKPGGGFLTGAEAQEESLARASNLYESLMTPTAQAFYQHHKEDRTKFYSHSMIYSPSVSLIRNSDDEWDRPVTASIITCAAVNAGVLRQRASSQDLTNVERDIQDTMKERMGRVLRLFEERGDKVLVLGSFGTGVFKNSVKMVATLWAELLRPGARFSGAFDEVVFAIIGNSTFEEFRTTFMEQIRVQ